MNGAQTPRIEHLPDFVSLEKGEAAVALARHAGLILDPWEEHVLKYACATRADGKWAAFEVGLNVPRQNGKNAVLEARELAGLFLFDEKLIMHSAHMFDTSLEAFRRLRYLIEEDEEPGGFLSRVKKRGGFKQSHGEEGIELREGARTRFRTRTKGGGRGFTGELVVMDEAMIVPESFHGTLVPIMAAMSITGNPQMWYTGSSVDQQIHGDGLVFAKVRARALRGNDPSLAYFEWSVDGDLTDMESVIDDPAMWAQANPGLGIRISEEHIARERRSMMARAFAVERLGIGDWPKTDEERRTITVREWEDLIERDSKTAGPVCFAFEVRPDRSWAAIGVAGMREDGRKHVEVIDARPGTGWVIERLEQLVADHEAVETGIVYNKAGPAASLQKGLEDLEKRGVKLKDVNAPEYGQACGILVDTCKQDALRHLGESELTAAVRGAVTRPMGDTWVWSQRQSPMNIAPLVSVTLALWGLSVGMPTRSVYEDRGVLVV